MHLFQVYTKDDEKIMAFGEHLEIRPVLKLLTIDGTSVNIYTQY